MPWVRPGANRTRACSLGKSRPVHWTTGRWETRRESNPTGGFADRLSPGESRAIGALGPIRTADLQLRTLALYPLRYEDMKCAGEDSNLRVGCPVYSRVRSPLRHRRLG